MQQTVYPPKVNGSTAQPISKTFTGNQSSTASKTTTSNLQNRKFSHLDWIHIVFLFYSGAHNTINAWHRAENGLFFIFVLVGILTVEIMLWSIYKYWKEGKLIGGMLRVAKWAGVLAMFYATAGILAQGGAEAWVTIHHRYILPTSAPVMFFFAFWIQAVDPIIKAQRDTEAYAYLSAIDKRREKLDIERMELNERRQRRKLLVSVSRRKLQALWKEADSRRTKNTLKKSSLVEMPVLLQELGVSVKEANSQNRFISLKSKYDAPKELPANAPINPAQIPGAHNNKQVKK